VSDSIRPHPHVCGMSGKGKSSFLKSMIRHDIVAGRGLVVLDPHGELSDGIVRWCEQHGLSFILGDQCLAALDSSEDANGD
jgi:Helicase HerA, central domain